MKPKPPTPKDIEKAAGYYHKIETFVAGLTKADWIAILSSLSAAFIGAIISLFVVILTDRLQKKKDASQQVSNENNKLRYLRYLTVNTRRIFSDYALTVRNMRNSYNEDPFVIPDFITYPIHSLNTIVNNINQEDYYLAAVNRMGGEDISEIFSMYNYLYDIYTKSVDHYKNEFPLLIASKEAYRNNLNNLIESVNQYLISVDDKNLAEDEKLIYDQINALMGQLKINRYSTGVHMELRYSKRDFAAKLAAILDPRGDVKYRKLMLQAYQQIAYYDEYCSHINNVIEALEMGQKQQQSVVVPLFQKCKPLEDYVIQLNNQPRP